MKTLIRTFFILGVIAGMVWTVMQIHPMFNSLWLDGYLILCIGLPLLASLPNIVNGRQGVIEIFQSLFSISAGLLTLTLVYNYLMPNWVLACLAGAILPGLVTAIQSWRLTQARVALTQAYAELEGSNLPGALELARNAHIIFVKRGIHDGQAEADLIIGAACFRMNENLRAARHLTAAHTYFQRHQMEQRAQQAATLLTQIRNLGVSVQTGEQEGEDDDEPKNLDGQFVLNVASSTACFLALIILWDVQALKSSIPVTAWSGVLIFTFIVGNFAVLTINTGEKKKRPVAGPFLLFNLALTALAAGTLSLLNQYALIQAEGFAFVLVQPAAQALAAMKTLPEWVPISLAGGGLLLIILALLIASNRSPLGFLKLIFGGDQPEKNLKLGLTHLESEAWKEAISEFSRLDLIKERNIERKKTALFGLSLAHFKESHPADAREYANELLEIDAKHPEGLYLAGYLALTENRMDDAEVLWKRLDQINPRFQPAGTGGSKWTARYYYSLVLYRKSMELMNKDLDAGAEILSTVGALGALDQQVADALIRVHLYRFAQLARQGGWSGAAQEAELANSKLASLKSAGLSAEVVSKLTAFCLAAQGLLAFKQEQYANALEKFKAAADAVKGLHKEDVREQTGSSLLEDLLRRIYKSQESKNQIDLRFPRDIQYLSAVALLYQAYENLEASGAASKMEKYLEQARNCLEAALGSAPSFMEGRTLIGLIFYYLERDENERRKGIEALQSVREHTGSKFVSQTLAKYDEDQHRREDARKAYFDLLQSYMRSSNVPTEQRQELRDEVLGQMKASGEYQTFLGTGSLEIKDEKEPTVNEYIQRSDLLRVKMQQLLETQSAEGSSPQISELIGQLNSRNSELQTAIKNITELEMKILKESQGLF